MNPHLEQRLRKLEEKIITAQRRERHIKIRWIRKGERLRPGLHYVLDLVPVKENLPPEEDNNPPALTASNSRSSNEAEKPEVDSDSAASNEGEKQEARPETELATEDLEGPDTQQPPTEMTLQAPPAKEPDDAMDEGRRAWLGDEQPLPLAR